MADKEDTKPDAEKPKTAPKQQPSIGCVVHFVNDTQHVPALITDPATHFHAPRPDGPGIVAAVGQALAVFPPNAPMFTTVATEDTDGAPATWHWPEYVPAQ